MQLIPPLLGLAFLVVTAAAQPIAGVYQPPANFTVLGTTFVDWDSLLVRPTKGGQTRAVFDNPTPTLEKFEMHITTLLPQMQSHPVHQHPWEEMLLIKEGQVELSINGQKHPAGAGDLIFFAAHDPHNLTNVGATPATYYVINFCTDLVHSVADKPALEQAVPGKMGSTVVNCNNLSPAKTPTGSRVSLFESPTLTFLLLSSHITTLDPGKSTANGIVDSGDELFVVRSGKLEVTVNGTTARLNEGSFFYCAPNDKRTLRNIGATSASYHVIKVVSARTPRA